MNFNDLNAIKNLPHLWTMAAEKEIDTSARIDLYKKTEDAVSFLGRNISEISEYEKKEITELANTLLEGFKELDKSQSDTLSKWIAHNTSDSVKGSKMEYEGAYPVLHHLFEAIGKIKNEKVDPANIDSRSLSYYDSLERGFPWVNEETRNVYFSKASSKDLLEMYYTSKENRAIILPIFITRLNKGELNLNELGIKTVEGATKFFGKRCSEIHTLDLSNFEKIDDEDIKLISEKFNKINYLNLRGANITNEFCLKDMKSLISLEISFCQQITDFEFLKNLNGLKSLTLSGNKQITDINFLKSLENLEEINLSSCDGIEDFSPLRELDKLKKINIHNCTLIDDISFLKDLKKLTSLDISWCRQIKDFSPVGSLHGLEELNLSRSNQLQDISFLESLKNLKELNLSNCWKLKKISFLNGLQKLASLNLSQCTIIDDFNFLKKLDGLKNLSLANCKQLTDFSFLENFKHLTHLNLKGCNKDADLSFLNDRKELEILR